MKVQLKIGDTIMVRKALTVESFRQSVEWMSTHPLQDQPMDYEYVTILDEDMLAKFALKL